MGSYGSYLSNKIEQMADDINKLEAINYDLSKKLSLFSRIKDWSEKTFGSGNRTIGLIEHIREELKEVQDKPYDLKEWVDVMLLAFDGY